MNRSSGSKWQPKASELAGWDLAAKLAQQAQGGNGFVQGGERLCTYVQVVNDTEDPLEHLACVSFRDPQITPASDEAKFQFDPIVKCQLPTEAEIYRHGILIEPLLPGQIGLALIAGVTAVRITGDGIGDGAKFAKPNGGETALEASPSEGWPLLWAESGAPAERWALVEVGGGGGGCGETYDFRFIGGPVGGFGKFTLTYNAVPEVIQVDYDMTDALLKSAIDAHSELTTAGRTCRIVNSTGSPNGGNVIIEIPSGATITWHSQALTRSTHGVDPTFYVWVVGPCG